MKKKIIWIIVALVIVTGAILGLTVFKGGKNGKVEYRTEVIGKGDIEALVVTSGTLNPIETVDVGAQVSGKIEKLYADFNTRRQEGRGRGRARPGAPEDEDRPERGQLQEPRRLARAVQGPACRRPRRPYERAKTLFAKELISIEEMDAAEATYLNAKSDLVSSEASLAQAKSTLDLSKVDLGYAVIKAPVDGVVITRKVNIGQTLQSSYAAPVLFQVATDLTKMKVECSVDESDIGKVKEGQKVRFTVEAYPNETFNGVVQQVRFSPETVQNVVTYTTIVNVDNPEKKLLPGMTATVSIIVGEAKNVLRVSNAALRFTPNSEPRRARGQAEGDDGPDDGPAPGPGRPARRAAGPGRGRSVRGRRPGRKARRARARGTFTRQGGGQGTGQARAQMPRVWLQDKDGKLSMMFAPDRRLRHLVHGDRPQRAQGRRCRPRRDPGGGGDGRQPAAAGHARHDVHGRASRRRTALSRGTSALE